MPQQRLVGPGSRQAAFALPDDAAAPVSRRLNLVDQPAGERIEIDRHGAAAGPARLDAAQHQHLLHETGHQAGGPVDVLEQFPLLLLRQAFVVVAHQLDGRHDDAERRAELVAHQGHKAALQFAQLALLLERPVQVGMRLLQLGGALLNPFLQARIELADDRLDARQFRLALAGLAQLAQQDEHDQARRRQQAESAAGEAQALPAAGFRRGAERAGRLGVRQLQPATALDPLGHHQARDLDALVGTQVRQAVAPRGIQPRHQAPPALLQGQQFTGAAVKKHAFALDQPPLGVHPVRVARAGHDLGQRQGMRLRLPPVRLQPAPLHEAQPAHRFRLQQRTDQLNGVARLQPRDTDVGLVLAVDVLRLVRLQPVGHEGEFAGAQQQATAGLAEHAGAHPYPRGIRLLPGPGGRVQQRRRKRIAAAALQELDLSERSHAQRPGAAADVGAAHAHPRPPPVGRDRAAVPAADAGHAPAIRAGEMQPEEAGAPGGLQDHAFHLHPQPVMAAGEHLVHRGRHRFRQPPRPERAQRRLRAGHPERRHHQPAGDFNLGGHGRQLATAHRQTALDSAAGVLDGEVPALGLDVGDHAAQGHKGVGRRGLARQFGHLRQPGECARRRFLGRQRQGRQKGGEQQADGGWADGHGPRLPNSAGLGEGKARARPPTKVGWAPAPPRRTHCVTMS